ARHLSILHAAAAVEALPLRGDVDEHAVAGDARHHLEASAGVLHLEGVLPDRADGGLDRAALHDRARLAGRDVGAASLEHADALVDALVARSARILRPHLHVAAAIADPAARFDRLPREFARIVETHQDLQVSRGAVDGLQRAPDLGDIGGTRAHDELALLPGERAARLEQGPQRR